MRTFRSRACTSAGRAAPCASHTPPFTTTTPPVTSYPRTPDKRSRPRPNDACRPRGSVPTIPSIACTNSGRSAPRARASPPPPGRTCPSRRRARTAAVPTRTFSGATRPDSGSTPPNAGEWRPICGSISTKENNTRQRSGVASRSLSARCPLGLCPLHYCGLPACVTFEKSPAITIDIFDRSIVRRSAALT